MDISPGALFFGVIFSSWGLMAVQIGRKRQSARPIVLGFLLMALPFVVAATPLAWLGAIVLGVLCFWP